MEKQSLLKSRYQELQKVLEEQQTFIMPDVEMVFPELEKATRYWLVAELVKNGYIKRIRRGTFAFNEWRGKKNITISKEAERLSEVLSETGFYYFISGLDILAKYMQHIPEQYPIMLFVEKAAKEEVKSVLLGQKFFVIDSVDLKIKYEDMIYAGREETLVVLYLTDSFEYGEGGLATIEKAFVDTFYSVTRNGYPLALQELVRIYENLVRTGNIDRKKTVTIAGRRSIQYDIRYIVESDYITEEARRFVEIMRRER
ncbi:MAG: hypothetical protein IKQ49_06235 [Eubacterium sp.]|nr:hypothetical protein [Eubacterium sp.]